MDNPIDVFELPIEKRIQKFKDAVLKNVPEKLGAVELYSKHTGYYCVAGLALHNLGYTNEEITTTKIDVEGGYGLFKKEFGFIGGTIGCVNDDFIHKSVNAEYDPSFNMKRVAPAREIIDKVFNWINTHKESLSSLDG